MNVEFERSFLSQHIKEELELEEYLSLFQKNIPLIPSKILKPMKKKEGLDRFERVGKIDSLLEDSHINQLVECSRQLPRLDALLPLYDLGRLEQYHLFELSSFLAVDGSLALLEEEAPLDPAGQKVLVEMQALLKERTGNQFSVIAKTDKDTQLLKALNKLESERTEKVSGYEKHIFDQTGLKMIYPWPKEIAVARESSKKIKACSLVTVEQKKDVWLIDYRPDKELLSLNQERDRLTQEFETIMSEKLQGLNSDLHPYFKSFAKYYEKRKERTWDYVLIEVKRKYNFTFPLFTTSTDCRIKKGYLWGLHKRKKEKCIPLDLELAKGANVLYGANMSGKTTVLKTIFSLLSLIQCGLPVPAEAVTMNYPEYVSIMLKSSGNIKQDISAFGEEVTFFSRETPDGAYILVDELFLSTDPVNGATLSEIIIDDFSQKEMIFFCTTHYTDVVSLDNITLMRMEDIDPASLSRKITDITEFREKMPYRLEHVTDSDDRRALLHNKKPLEIALLFPLSSTIKEKILTRLNKKNNE